MKNFIFSYALNVERCNAMMKGFSTCIAKRVLKEKPVELNHLAGCSTMKKIVSAASNECRKLEGYNPTALERKEAAQLIAEYILNDCVKYEIINLKNK